MKIKYTLKQNSSDSTGQSYNIFLHLAMVCKCLGKLHCRKLESMGGKEKIQCP